MAKSETRTGRPSGDLRISKRRKRLGYIVIAVIAAVATFGWAYVMWAMRGTPGISAQEVTYRAVDASAMELRFSVHKSADQEVRCAIRALDGRFAEVGRREVVLPRGVDHIERTEQITTSTQGVVAKIDGCHPV